MVKLVMNGHHKIIRDVTSTLFEKDENSHNEITTCCDILVGDVNNQVSDKNLIIHPSNVYDNLT